MIQDIKTEGIGSVMDAYFRAALREELREVYSEMMREAEKRAEAKQNDSLVSVEDARSTLQVTKVTLWRWGKSGYLKPIMVGGKKLYRRSDIQRIIKNG
jgi:hypothetical protein